jgi:hypothetical protein
MNIYAIITIVFALFYALVLYITSTKLKELKGMVTVPANWTKGTNVKELKLLTEQTNDARIRAKAEQIISLINLSKYMMYGIFITYTLLMAMGV